MLCVLGWAPWILFVTALKPRHCTCFTSARASGPSSVRHEALFVYYKALSQIGTGMQPGMGNSACALARLTKLDLAALEVQLLESCHRCQRSPAVIIELQQRQWQQQGKKISDKHPCLLHHKDARQTQEQVPTLGVLPQATVHEVYKSPPSMAGLALFKKKPFLLADRGLSTMLHHWLCSHKESQTKNLKSCASSIRSPDQTLPFSNLACTDCFAHLHATPQVQGCQALCM